MASKAMRDFAKSIDRYLIETMLKYGAEVSYDISIAMNEVGQEAKERVAAASPKRTGKYKRGWRVDFKNENGVIRCVIHQNSKQYRLTHLLENGHRTRLGTGKSGRTYGRKATVRAQPHIAEVNAWAQKELERRIRKALGG